MATSHPSVQDTIWKEYVKVASDVDARLVKEWSDIIDAVLVFVPLFSGVLTAFIIRTSDMLHPPHAEATNKILIAIYNRTMNGSAPIDLDQFLRLDERNRTLSVYQNWLLYTSLTISIVVAALCMAAKLWVVRYGREVTAPGPPRARAIRRHTIYNGLLAWKMGSCIDAMPLLVLAAVLLFAIFIHSSVSAVQPNMAYFLYVIFNMGFAFIIVASFSAAFIYNSPFRSPFSDFINFISQIFPVPTFMPIRQIARWRTVVVLLSSILSLAAGAYLVVRQTYAGIPCIYYAVAGAFTLMHEGREKDMPPRLFDLPQWVFLASITIFVCFIVSIYVGGWSTLLCIIFFVLASFFLVVMGYVSTKMSETRPATAEAEAVSWLLKMSSNKDPAWFQMAVQIAGQSPNARALLLQKLFPLLLPLITPSLPDRGGGVTDERESYITTLANLMDFAPRKQSFWRNEASLERPRLPERLIAGLEHLRDSGVQCAHSEVHGEEKWNDGSVRCPKACVNDTVRHILQLYESDMERKKLKTKSDETA